MKVYPNEVNKILNDNNAESNALGNTVFFTISKSIKINKIDKPVNTIPINKNNINDFVFLINLGVTVNSFIKVDPFLKEIKVDIKVYIEIANIKIFANIIKIASNTPDLLVNLNNSIKENTTPNIATPKHIMVVINVINLCLFSCINYSIVIVSIFSIASLIKNS